MSAWYSIRDGKPAGPFTDEAMREQCRSGVTKRSDQVWKEGEPAWKPAGETELTSLFPPAFPSRPPPYRRAANAPTKSARANTGSAETVISIFIVIAAVLFVFLVPLSPLVRGIIATCCLTACGALNRKGKA